MPFKPTLVALPEDPTGFPYLGFPVTEIELSQPNGEGAALPRAVGFESRDKFTEGVTGSDSRIARRKLADIEMVIDYVTAENKAEIERLILDDRAVYFCPNIGPMTRWSFPLQRSLADFMGRKTMANTRNGKAYLWDETDRVFRVVDTDQPQFGFRGAWSRYLRTQSGQVNKATKPHPDSASSGWTTVVGLVTQTYTEDILTPVLSERATTNGKGVYLMDVDATVTSSIQHNGLGVSTTNNVVASVCMAWTGQISVLLEDLSGSPIYDIKTLDGDGGFQLIRLGGANSNSAANARLRIVFNDTASGQKQQALMGPTFIGSDNNAAAGTPKIVDWSDGVATDVDRVYNTDTVDHLVGDLSISWFTRWTANEANYFRLGVNPDSIYMNRSASATAHTVTMNSNYGSSAGFTNLDVDHGVAVGDWVHFVLVCSTSSGVSLYVNGQKHSYSGTRAWEPHDFGHTLRIGYDLARPLDTGGISHLRCDATEWTAQQVLDHYDTYFKPAGRGVIEPLFGKQLVIESADWAPLTVSDAGAGDAQWRATLTMRELGPDINLAGLQRQEGGV